MGFWDRNYIMFFSFCFRSLPELYYDTFVNASLKLPTYTWVHFEVSIKIKKTYKVLLATTALPFSLLASINKSGSCLTFIKEQINLAKATKLHTDSILIYSLRQLTVVPDPNIVAVQWTRPAQITTHRLYTL